MIRIAILFTFASLLSGCVVIPFPHRAVPHSNITGRVVDAATGTPISNIQVELEYAGPVVVTKPDGAFTFVAKRRWHFFAILPLVEMLQHCPKERLVFTDADHDRRSVSNQYEKSVREVNSQAYPKLPLIPVVLFKRPRNNLTSFENVGDVKLKRR